MEPTEALARIAYLLEVSGAPSYKVQAFRKAVATLADVEQTRLEELAASGRLRSLPGVGETTARVIAEALEGREPEYLVRLEREQLRRSPVSLRSCANGCSGTATATPTGQTAAAPSGTWPRRLATSDTGTSR